MSFDITENVYGITESGKKVKIGTVTTSDPDIHRVAGKIFYIDDNASGASYTFYDENGNEIQSVSVGDEPYAYKVNGTPSADKYYIANPNILGDGKWRPGTSTSTVSPVTSDYTGAIGTGKLCSEEAMSALDGALVQSSETVWYAVNQINNAAGAVASDWYLPSKDELTELYNSEVIENFSHNKVWSSTEHIRTSDGLTNTAYFIDDGVWDYQYNINVAYAYAIRSF